MSKTTTEMQLVAVSKLIPYVNNARTHSAEQVMKLRSSLREFGFINPVIIDREFNVIAGHGRILAAKEEGILEVPCVFVDYLTEAQKKAYILADNRMAMDVANPKKTDNGRLITGYACDSRTADAEFLLAKRQYIAATGRVRGTDDVIAYHVRQSFRPGEITPEEANRLGVEFARRFTKENHAFVVCTHIDKAHVHNHIIWSSVSLEYDRKFRNF